MYVYWLAAAQVDADRDDPHAGLADHRLVRQIHAAGVIIPSDGKGEHCGYAAV